MTDPPGHDLGEHYANLGARYERNAFYDPQSAFNRWLLPRVASALGLTSSARLADLGGGTGAFSEALAATVGLVEAPTIVEPSRLREQAQARGLACIDQNVEQFAADPIDRGWDALLLKEVVHHLPLVSFGDVCQGLARRLSPTGSLLIVTRPRISDHPFFEAARSVWRAQQPPTEPYREALLGAGLAVHEEEHAFSFAVAKQDWFELIRGRFWSTFASFSDEELEEGIRELDSKSADTSFRFDDRLLFLIAGRD